MPKLFTLPIALQRLTVIFALTVSLLPAQAQSLTDDTVFQQFGGKAGIQKVVADFLPLLLAEQFCQLTGGPCKYSGKQMQEAHQDMHLNNAQFNALAEDLQMAMEKNAVANSAQNKLVARLAPMQRAIVSK